MTDSERTQSATQSVATFTGIKEDISPSVCGISVIFECQSAAWATRHGTWTL